MIDAAFNGEGVVRVAGGHPVAIAEAAVVAHYCTGGRIELLIEDDGLRAAVEEALTRVMPRAPGRVRST